MRVRPILLLAGFAALLAASAARAEEGVLHLNGTPGARAWVDGRSVGELPVVALRLDKGFHEIRLARPGYETLERKIWVGPVRSEGRVYYLHKKRRRDAAWRSALLPGWGTRYGDEHRRGAFYTAAEAGLLLYALYQDIRFHDRKDEYEEKDRIYGAALTDAEIAGAREERLTAYERMDESETNRDGALIAAAAVYGVSLLDAVLLFPYGGDEPAPFALRPRLETGPFGARASLRMRF